MSDSPVVSTAGTSISKYDDDTILIQFKDGSNIDLAEAREIRNQAFAILPDRKFFSIIDASKIFGNVEPEALKFFAGDGELISRRMAQAIVVDNLALKILATFYLRVIKPEREAKIFSNIKDASNWLAERKHLLQ